jgi:hypothetical protein
MSALEEEAAIITTPKMGQVAAFAVGTSTGRTDLSAIDALSVAGKPGVQQGHYITLIADAAMYFNFNNAASGNASAAAVTGNDRSWLLPGGVPMHVILDEGFTFMNHIAAVATICRVYVSSKRPTQLGANHA